MLNASLVIAGFGAIGQAFVRLYGDYVRTFRSVHVLDVEVPETMDSDILFHRADVSDLVQLDAILSTIEGPFLFMNLTAGVDAVRIRRLLAGNDAAYLDTGCSAMHQADVYHYSTLMPYTYTDVGTSKPHLLCCGLNPGLVELLVRKLLREHFAESKQVDIVIFEQDTLASAEESDSHVPVSWSPATLIDEVLLSPTLLIRDGQVMETPHGPTELTNIQWAAQSLPACLVGHEDIWNMQTLKEAKVRHCAYAYTFSETVMQALARGEAFAKQVFYVPDAAEPISGTDELAIRITDADSGRSKLLSWNLDHGDMWNRFQLNAVQFQVCASIRLFCEMMTSSPFCLNGWHHASNIPMDNSGWQWLDTVMRELDIQWQERRPADLAMRHFGL